MTESVFEAGRICIQLRGRRAGNKVIVIEKVSPARVLVEGVSVKRRACNVDHLFPTQKKALLGKNPNREEIVKALS